MNEEHLEHLVNEKPLEVVALVAKGDKGEKGDPGLTRGARRAMLYLLALVLLLGGVNLFWSAHEVRANQQAERRAGQMVERKLCATLDELAALRPPPGDPATNPARGYDQQLHATLAQLGTDVGCRR